MDNQLPQSAVPTIWETNPKLKILLLVLIFVFLFSGIGLTAFSVWGNNYRQKVYEETKAGLPVHQESKSASQQISESEWKTYRNEEYGFEFKYPNNLSLSENNSQVVLNHSIPYKNGGDCDMIGDGKQYDNLVDFKVSFQIASTAPLSFFDGSYDSGNLKGSWVYEGVEGCGQVVYYFDFSKGKTLVVKKDVVQALSGVSTLWDKEAILKVPGVISVNDSAQFLDQILSTFKFTK